VATVLLGASALAQLFWARTGGSLAVRLGWPAAAVMSLWQLLGVCAPLTLAATADALLLHRRRGGLAARPLTVLTAWLLALVDMTAWGSRVLLGAALNRDHVGLIVHDVDKIMVLTTPGERSLFFAVPVAALAVALLAVGSWHWRERVTSRVSLRVHALVVAGLAAIVAIGHSTTLLNRREVYDRATSQWTTVGEIYRFHLLNDGLWLPQLLLGGTPRTSLHASQGDNARFVRVGAPLEPMAAWAARAVKSRPQPPNVILIQIDSVRFGEPVQTGGDPRVLPNLSRLASRGLLFDRCYAPTTETAYSLPAMLDGQYSLRRPTRDYHDDLDYPSVALAELLRTAGYRTAIFSSHWLSWQRMNRVIRPDQYDDYVVIRDLAALPGDPAAPTWLRRAVERRGLAPRVAADLDRATEFDQVGAELLEDWLSLEPGRPFFAVLAQIAAHYPYRWPAGLAVPFAVGDRGALTSFFTYPLSAVPVMRDAYHNALFADDVVLGEVLETLERQGLADTTLVVVATDHGQSFGEHGLVTHARAPMESQVRTPLVLAGPGVPVGRSSQPISLIDLPPTVLGRLGFPTYGAFQGWDMLDPGTPPDRPLYFSMQSPMTTQDAVIAAGHKYIEDFATGGLSLFDLRRDPGETVNLLERDADPLLSSRLQRDLRAWHMSQLVYYATPELRRRFFPPRYGALFKPTQVRTR
jgi:arylsulfatase A-like enzyme